MLSHGGFSLVRPIPARQAGIPLWIEHVFSCGCFILVVSSSPQFYLLILRAHSLNEKKGTEFLAWQDRLVRGHCNPKVHESKMRSELTNHDTDIVLTSAKLAMNLWMLMSL